MLYNAENVSRGRDRQESSTDDDSSDGCEHARAGQLAGTAGKLRRFALASGLAGQPASHLASQSESWLASQLASGLATQLEIWLAGPLSDQPAGQQAGRLAGGPS